MRTYNAALGYDAGATIAVTEPLSILFPAKGIGS